MAKEKCPSCGDFQGVSDYDPDCGKFYTCEACGHRWAYADEVRQHVVNRARDECCNTAARSGKWGCDKCGREWS